MGGSGSGNSYHWWRASKKGTVEDCLSLDANRWTREGILKPGIWRAGSWRWAYHSGNSFAVRYVVNTGDGDRPAVHLEYSYTLPPEERVYSANYTVALTSTRPRFGGLRWWFICPLIVNGRACGRRVGKLHLPPRAHYFGCRLCHELTYTSYQDSHKYDKLYRLMADPGESPDDVRRAFKVLTRLNTPL